MADEPDAGQPTGEVPADLKATLEGPAVSANRFFVTLAPNGVRIAFSEQVMPGLDFKFRAAVLISYEDAVQLRNVLQNMLAPIEAEIDKASRPDTTKSSRPDPTRRG